MANRNTILQLLNKLSENQPQLASSLNCRYTDGAGTSIYEIKFRERAEGIQKGRLVFQLENNRISYCRYHKFDGKAAEDVIDTLLDLINLEKSAVQA